MPLDGLPIRCGRTVRDAKFFSGLLDDGRQFAEVDVADLREEVVLNLVLEASVEPRRQVPLPVLAAAAPLWRCRRRLPAIVALRLSLIHI